MMSFVNFAETNSSSLAVTDTSPFRLLGDSCDALSISSSVAFLTHYMLIRAGYRH